MSYPTHFSRQWSEAHYRAEAYLRTLRGRFETAERQLVTSAMASARGQVRLNPEAHPVTLVMEALFGFLPDAEAVAMTPPIERTRMLPEPMEFPLHDCLRRIFRRAA